MDQGIRNQQNYLGLNKVSSSEISTGYSDNVVSKSTLLEENLTDYSSHLEFLENLVSKIERIGHSLHDTNFPEKGEQVLQPSPGIGKFIQMKEMNTRFLQLNQKLDIHIQKLNTLI